MEYYTKGRNEEEELNSGNIPLIGIPEDHGWMLITGRTRLQTALGPACTLIKDEGCLVLAGIGSSIKRVEKLVDMLKQKMKGLFQVNKGGERIVREYWDPKSEDLDHLVVTRVQPTLHVLLSVERIECEGEDVIVPAPKSSSGKKKKPRGCQEGNDPSYQRRCNEEVQEAAAKEGKRTRRPRRGNGNEKRGQEAGPALKQETLNRTNSNQLDGMRETSSHTMDKNPSKENNCLQPSHLFQSSISES